MKYDLSSSASSTRDAVDAGHGHRLLGRLPRPGDQLRGREVRRDRVAQIITFGTTMARAAVRDAGRVLEVPYGTVDKVAKLIPEGVKVYLDDCLKPGSEFKAAYDGDPIVREIVDLAKPLEGPCVGLDHAAGVVIPTRR